MIEEVKEKVCELLNNEQSGHDMEHINRVLNLSLKFCEKEQGDKDIVSLIALLHDVDDYKLFGMDNAKNLTNARKIMSDCKVDENIHKQVIAAIETIGYSKRLKGIEPKAIEAKIVSDADMCDGIGATGILRSYQYNIYHGNLFFDKDVFPVLDMSSSDYMNKKDGTVVTHMFEKLLRLKDMMLTPSGKIEASERHHIMVLFLNHYFHEVGAIDWIKYLEQYLNK